MLCVQIYSDSIVAYAQVMSFCFFSKAHVQIFGPFLIWLFSVLWLNLKALHVALSMFCIYVLWLDFVFLTTFLVEQKFEMNLIRYKQIFSFMDFVFGDVSENSLTKP